MAPRPRLTGAVAGRLAVEAGPAEPAAAAGPVTGSDEGSAPPSQMPPAQPWLPGLRRPGSSCRHRSGAGLERSTRAPGAGLVRTGRVFGASGSRPGGRRAPGSPMDARPGDERVPRECCPGARRPAPPRSGWPGRLGPPGRPVRDRDGRPAPWPGRPRRPPPRLPGVAVAAVGSSGRWWSWSPEAEAAGSLAWCRRTSVTRASASAAEPRSGSWSTPMVRPRPPRAPRRRAAPAGSVVDPAAWLATLAVCVPDPWLETRRARASPPATTTRMAAAAASHRRDPPWARGDGEDRPPARGSRRPRGSDPGGKKARRTWSSRTLVSGWCIGWARASTTGRSWATRASMT